MPFDYEIVGYVSDGNMYHPECCSDHSSPIFVQDCNIGDYCYECFSKFVETHNVREPDYRNQYFVGMYLEYCDPHDFVIRSAEIEQETEEI